MKIQKWIMKHGRFIEPLLFWCARHDSYHIGPFGHIGKHLQNEETSGS
jgi:hypothetical protein